jgi:hypothetical protein
MIVGGHVNSTIKRTGNLQVKNLDEAQVLF